MGTNSFIQIGNSDDRLTQSRWAAFVRHVRLLLTVEWRDRLQIHGEWFSSPDQPWQNANWCVEILPPKWWERASEQAGREHPSALPQATVARDAEMHENRLRLKEEIRDLCRRYSQDSFAWTSGTVELVATGLEDTWTKHEDGTTSYGQAMREGWLPTPGAAEGSTPNTPEPASTGAGEPCPFIACLIDHPIVSDKPCVLDSPTNRTQAKAEQWGDLKSHWHDHLIGGKR